MRPLDELRDVERATVLKSGVHAAILERRAGSVVFTYTPDYLASSGPPVATTLPLRHEPVTAGSAGALPPFFSGLLPEGRRLTALRTAVKTSADDELTLLLAVGSDTIGDVQVVPEGEDPLGAEARLQVHDWREVRFADLFRSATGVPLDRVGIPGVQDKVSARMVSLPVARGHERHLLKVDPPEFAHLVENEAFFLEAARASGLRAADAEVVHDGEGAPGLLVRRFDRVKGDGGDTRARAQEDACQVLGLYPADKYRASAEEVVAGLASVCRAQPVAAMDLVRQFAFAYLTCNGDAHAKNFSVVRADTDEWRIAPAYDLPSSYPYGDTTMALSVNGRRREDAGRADFVALAAGAGLPERAVTRMLDDLCDRVDLWIDDVSNLPFDAGILRKLRRAIEYRRGRLSGARPGGARRTSDRP